MQVNGTFKVDASRKKQTKTNTTLIHTATVDESVFYVRNVCLRKC